IEKLGEKQIRIGDYVYEIKKHQIELHEFLINPIYWLGNEGLVSFTDESILQWYRQSSEEESINFTNKVELTSNLKLTESYFDRIEVAGEKSLFGLHLALVLLQSSSFDQAIKGVNYLAKMLNDETQQIFKIAFYFLDKPQLASNVLIQRELFLLAMKKTSVKEFKHYFEIYLKMGIDLFDDSVKTELIRLRKDPIEIETISTILDNEIERKQGIKELENSVIPILLDILALYGIKYPTKYEDLRRRLVKIQLNKEWKELSSLARTVRTKMRNGFRNWLGGNETVAVDIETEEEYGWTDVIIFEEEIKLEEKNLLIEVISETAILRESVFLFYKGIVIRLSDVLSGGIWISTHSEHSRFKIFRVSIQTRHQGAFDILLRLNKYVEEEKFLDEINWLILAGSHHYLHELVENIGGYWNDYKMWSQKYLTGYTVEQIFKRGTRKQDETVHERFVFLWPFFIWNAAAAYINFWEITNRKFQLKKPSATNIITPSHDYQSGTRFEVLGERENSNSVSHLLFTFYNKFVIPIEDEYEFVKNKKVWNYIFSGVINAEGEKEGAKILTKFLEEIKSENLEKNEIIIPQLEGFLKNITDNGYIPKPIYFAIKRFNRWYKLNTDASIDAQARMLNELYDTYYLNNLESYYPETRTRFYSETVLKKSQVEICSIMKEVCRKQHDNEMGKEEFLKEISRTQKEYPLSEKESFFLTRLSYPHLKPSDTATFVDFETGGEHTANLVVEVEDYEGDPLYLRKPVSPKEISKLHQLFIDANLQVSFKPEHQFLVAISERGYIIGGLFYSKFEKEVVHMEKIVVSNIYRRKGISEAIMNEFFSRMSDEGNAYVTTGFFRPEYFYRFDFKIEKKYSGLVKKMDKEKVTNE
ncbi:MAG: GNAT family N-acetyltransferase, partial [Ignavibacteriae bacterium]|nr:GNAT family N-acetyltransferase [Ignavibacteriota bacterium]